MQLDPVLGGPVAGLARNPRSDTCAAAFLLGCEMAPQAKGGGLDPLDAQLACDTTRFLASRHVTEGLVVAGVLPDGGFLGVALGTCIRADRFRLFYGAGLHVWEH